MMRLLFLFIPIIFLLSFFVPFGNFVSLVSVPHTSTDASLKERPAFIDQLYVRFDTIRTPLVDYAWPTDASKIITSTFGEYRRIHFHAGIDIGTNNRTGYRVFAARDGYIWRISISPMGYGKVLYVKHDDGYVTTYAHLKSFNDSINALVRREQLRLERYPIDITLEPSTLPVKKGDIIAYTGSSGIGSPHLHFEIRDENFNPINPQLFDNIAISDNFPPAIRSIVVIPLDNNSSIAGKRQPLILRHIVGQKGLYRLPQKISAGGRIGFGINVRDRIDGTYHRVGIHRLELYLNDSLTFSAQLDRLPANESKQVLLFYNLPLLKSGKGHFQQLFIEENTSLLIYERGQPGAGIIVANTMSEGDQRFTIICKDIHGNATSISGTITLSRSPKKNVYVLAANAAHHTTTDENLKDIFTIPTDTSGWFSFDRDTVQIVYDSGAVFKPLNVHIEKKHKHGEAFYRLHPQDVLLNKGVHIFIRSSPKGVLRTNPQNASRAMYVRDNHHFELLPTTFDSTTGFVATSLTYTLGDIALMKDTTPPQIVYLKINSRGKRPTVQFRVYDDLSGIDANEIKTYIDDEFVIPEIDDRSRVRCETEKPLTKGKHVLRIIVKDNMQNASSYTRSFAVP